MLRAYSKSEGPGKRGARPLLGGHPRTTRTRLLTMLGDPPCDPLTIPDRHPDPARRRLRG